jgi:hypothetical protein
MDERTTKPFVLGWHFCPWDRRLKHERKLIVAPGWTYYLSAREPIVMCSRGLHMCSSYSEAKWFAPMARRYDCTRRRTLYSESRIWLCRVSLSGDLMVDRRHRGILKSSGEKNVKWVGRERTVLWMVPTYIACRGGFYNRPALPTVSAVMRRQRWEPNQLLSDFRRRAKAAGEWPAEKEPDRA